MFTKIYETNTNILSTSTFIVVQCETYTRFRTTRGIPISRRFVGKGGRYLSGVFDKSERQVGQELWSFSHGIIHSL